MVLDGVTGRLCNPGNSNALAAALLEVLQNEERRREMGERARQCALLEYRSGVIAGMLLKAYLSVLESHEGMVHEGTTSRQVRRVSE